MNFQNKPIGGQAVDKAPLGKGSLGKGKSLLGTPPAVMLKQPNKNDSIRASYLNDGEIRSLGSDLAGGAIDRLPEYRPFDFIVRQKYNESQILQAYRSTREANERGEMITPAAEWLLDNHYLVEQNIRQVRRDLPIRFYRQLPTIDLPEVGALPRALALAWLYIAHTHSSLSLDSLTAMVEGYQEEKILKIGEIWALPSILRFVLIENLSRISQRVENSRDMRRRANALADHIQSEPGETSRALLTQYSRYAEDNSFAAQLLYRLRDRSDISEEAISWLETELEKRQIDAEEVLVLEHNRLSSGNATMGSIIRSLRKIDDTDWTAWFEAVSRVDIVLRQRSSFAELDFQSRDIYRDVIERLARRSAQAETFVAETALAMAEVQRGDDSAKIDVGAVLIGKRRPELEKAIGYVPSLRDRVGRTVRHFGWRSIALPTLALVPLFLLIGFWLLAAMEVPTGIIVGLLVLFFFPATEAAAGLYNTLISLTVRPTRLIGYEYKDGIPVSARTLLVVPCLITSRDSVDDVVRNLEVHYLANTAGEIYFALLSDWADSQMEESEADLDLLDYAQAEVNALADRYAFDGRTRFFLMHRRRLYNPSEGVWMGWERKRGKLHELNLFLRGDKDTTYLPLDRPLPDGIRYVMTLDSDTRLTRDAVTKLAGKLAHPLNAPVIDEASGRVVSGYGILQPRVTPSLTTGHEASAFQRIFSVNRGMDPYVFTVSDTYQDIADEGSFTGKGLYHIDAFEAALAGRLPENTVLSHDLIEGSFARSGLVSDVELVEDFPVRYQVEASRQHRWARGDWQLLPFIFGSGAGVSALGRWKMIDNLRRSLTPIFWLFGSVAGWTLLSLEAAILWQMVMIVSLFVAPTLALVSGAIPRRTDIIATAHMQSVMEEFASATAQVVLRIVFIAHTAWVMGDAIVRTFYRLFVSRRKLLEWRTAAQAHGSASVDLSSYYRAMWQAPVIALAALAFSVLFGDGGEIVAIPFCLLWALSPAAAWLVSRSAETEDRLVVSEADREQLRTAARRTWLYFETFVTDEHNHLPPDNFQETPAPVVAGRTSPTNIGIYLLSVISARDFGWISLENAIWRLERTVATLEVMEKHRGHLYNWYDTRTLKPLLPEYVSSVDSGNLAGHLIAVSSACRDWGDAPAAYLQGAIDGIGDVASILSEVSAEVADDRRTVRPLRRRLDERIQGFQRALSKLKHEPEFASIRTINLTVLAREIEKLANDLDGEFASTQSANLVAWAATLATTCEAHVADAVFDPKHVEDLRRRLIDLRERTRDIAFSMDFRFLLRGDRRLLSIGYRVAEKELDESCYDLLASEARLTSLFGIAKGDLPTEHWFRLGRPIVPVGAHGALMSWSGSMFEYLMPPLVMQERQGGILNQTNKLIVRRQMEYGAGLGIPWGISEAAFNARDPEMTYQYSNFGVPSLGLKRGLGENAVVAPYATMLASQYRPKDAVRNLERLRKLGALGRYGYYDALDFTPSRVPEKQRYAVVENYMAHHHGMSIAAIANVIFSGRLRDLFHSDPVIEAAELLLQEKAPRDVPVITIKHDEKLTSKGPAELRRAEHRIVRDPLEAERTTALLSNGHYSIMLTATGSGYARWNGLAVTRWKPDPTEDRWGSYIFLRDTRSGEWWSATAEPKQAPGEETLTIFADDKAEFYKTVGDLRSELECIVGVESDAEARRLTLVNRGTEDRFIEVTSFAELVISADDADAAHPAFSKMFVKTEIGASGDVIFAARNKRSNGEPDMHVAHLIVDSSNTARPTEAETDRRAFIGRNRSLGDAAAFDPGAHLTGSQGFTLDPILSLRRTVRVPAGKKVRVIYWTLAAPNRTELEQVVSRYRHAESFNHEMMQAWTRSQVQTRHVGISSQEAADFQRLARYLIYPDLDLATGRESFANGLMRQSALWPLSISGDYPICALRINDDTDLEIVRKALLGQEYLRSRGLVADLVIVNERAASYAQDMQRTIESMCENARLRGTAAGPRQHIFAVRRDLMEPAVYEALMAASRIVLHARNGKLATQIDRVSKEPPQPAEADLEVERGLVEETRPPLLLKASSLPAAAPPAAAAPPLPRREEPEPIDGSDLQFWNGFGGFAADGADYVVRLRGGEATPQPWINVISNGDFGFHVSAEGAGFSWSRNSRDYQLTPWTNDPVINRPGEAFYVADLDSGRMTSPLAALSDQRSQLFEARHGQGFSRFSTAGDGLSLALTQIVDPDNPVKLSRLTVRNDGKAARRLRVYGYVEWVLGNNRSKTAPFIVPGLLGESGALTASNPYSIEFSGRTAFFACSQAHMFFTTSRREFLGVGGTIKRPAAIADRLTLSGAIEPDGDPCAAIATDILVASGESRDIVFMLGDVDRPDKAAALAERNTPSNFEACFESSAARWDSFLETLQIDTPDLAMNIMVNRWLPYQSLACRITARSAFYQASGAYGFRDQLQDTMALLLHDPGLARAQILNAAGRQFSEGDVQHWWLPATGAGVRTMISDDVVWLAYAVAHYRSVTGDGGLLDIALPFIKGPELEPGQHDNFFQPETSEEQASIYEHCARALDLAVRRTGGNGLPLILGGDWNDGMNRVGEEGAGESVWLGWFLLKALDDFGPIAEARGDGTRAEAWRAHGERLREALAGPGWDGGYYRRGYFDDGTPLGSAESDECRIDSIAQSWSVLSGLGDAERSRQAMDAVLNQLVDQDARIIRLFTPPFERTEQEPGYIKGYPPGVRENGGQYTHAATWVVYALALMGRGDDAHACFDMLNPISHALDRPSAERYRVEPYVVAADVYSGDVRDGRGGWTWYTGSGGWLYRAAVEAILGIRRQGDRIIVDPALPAAWPGYSAMLKLDGKSYAIDVRRSGESYDIRVNDEMIPNVTTGFRL